MERCAIMLNEELDGQSSLYERSIRPAAPSTITLRQHNDPSGLQLSKQVIEPRLSCLTRLTAQYYSRRIDSYPIQKCPVKQPNTKLPVSWSILLCWMWALSCV